MLIEILNRWVSCSQDTRSSDGLDLPLSDLAEELGLHDDWLCGKESLSEYLEESGLGDIDDGDAVLVVSVELAGVVG